MTRSATPRLLEWDTQHFGVRVASLHGAALDDAAMLRALDWCRAERVECLYLRSDADDVTTLRSAGAAGFRFVDVRLTFDAELSDVAPRSAKTSSIRAARPDDAAALRAIAAYNHANTRFYADGRFARERCDALYATWIEKSLAGWADAVLVADEGAGPAGYLSIHRRPEDVGEIGLVGIARDAQGKGHGRALVEEGLAWMARAGCPTARVATQARNVAAQRLYQACGFRTRAVELWHHRWLDEPRNP